VLAESLRIGHPVYDVFYLVIARRNNAYLLTKDKKMQSIARALKIKVQHP
jgi:predicted nucleic acid-binding protein